MLSEPGIADVPAQHRKAVGRDGRGSGAVAGSDRDGFHIGGTILRDGQKAEKSAEGHNDHEDKNEQNGKKFLHRKAPFSP